MSSAGRPASSAGRAASSAASCAGAGEFHSSSRFLRADILASYSAPHASETSPANRMQTCLAALNLANVDGRPRDGPNKMTHAQLLHRR